MFKSITKIITNKYFLVVLAIIALSVGGYAFYTLKKKSPAQNIDEAVEEQITNAEAIDENIEQIAEEITRAAVTPASVQAQTEDLSQAPQVMPTELDREDFAPIN